LDSEVKQFDTVMCRILCWLNGAKLKSVTICKSYCKKFTFCVRQCRFIEQFIVNGPQASF